MSVIVAGLMFGGVQAALADPSDGLVAHWKLDGDATDAVGTNDGTLVNGPTFLGDPGLAAPIFANVDAIVFDGSLAVNDFVEVADDATLDLDGSFTLSAWVNREPSGNTQSVISKDTADNNETNYNFLLVNQKILLSMSFEDFGASITGTFGSNFLCANRSYGKKCSFRGVTSVGTGTWHHLGCGLN